MSDINHKQEKEPLTNNKSTVKDILDIIRIGCFSIIIVIIYIPYLGIKYICKKIWNIITMPFQLCGFLFGMGTAGISNNNNSKSSD